VVLTVKGKAAAPTLAEIANAFRKPFVFERQA
jgi:hypothetical protein